MESSYTMDKITRTLLLYSRLMKGEKINKFAFCMETDSIPRTFDRDIEDVRLYLSETFDAREIVYDRVEKVYYLTGISRKELELVEYQLLERILLDTGVLRRDELEVLLQHILSNTEKTINYLEIQKEGFPLYEEPIHKKALLKMHSDLASIIYNKSVIEMEYMLENDKIDNVKVIPCYLKYKDNFLYLVAFLIKEIESNSVSFRLDKIHSFTVQRTQLQEEKRRVDNFLKSDTSLFKNIKEYE